MTRLRITHVKRLRHEYRADIELDGSTVGHIERAESGKSLGYRAGAYRAMISGRVVATGTTLAELREELRAHFAAEYPDARESW